MSDYEHALEGPFGDHTGYYNERDWFPVFTIDRITMRREPIYHSTYTGKPPDEPAILGVALNEVFVPILRRALPEIADFYLPPEGCSYRMAVVSIRKQYAGHARRVMFGIWSVLRQFMYTKFIIVVDDDIDVRDWKEVVWAISTRVDPLRDTTLIDNTPIDYLDFASPVSGLGSKMGIDATNKWDGETTRNWGQPVAMDAAVKARVDSIWEGARALGDIYGHRAQTIAAAASSPPGYDRNQRVLEIEFDNGQVIQHTAVGEEIARRVPGHASSTGSVYKDTIQEEFTVKRIQRWTRPSGSHVHGQRQRALRAHFVSVARSGAADI